MARKKRRFDDVELPTTQPKEKVHYRDAFQQNVGEKLEQAGQKFEGKGKSILYGIAAVAVLIVVIGIFFAWKNRSDAAAQTALGKAIETSQAPISTAAAPAGTTTKTFKTDGERAEAAISEFQAVADKFGGDAAEKARYFIAVNRLRLDRAAGIGELQQLAKSDDEVGKMSKFALAQALATDGKLDESLSLYQELAGMNDPIVSKDSINFELAGLYEKQGKRQEAADLYYSIAKAASEAKDAEGKPIAMSPTARSAKEKLQELDPARAGEIVEPAPESPFGT